MCKRLDGCLVVMHTSRLEHQFFVVENSEKRHYSQSFVPQRTIVNSTPTGILPKYPTFLWANGHCMWTNVATLGVCEVATWWIVRGGSLVVFHGVIDGLSSQIHGCHRQ